MQEQVQEQVQRELLQAAMRGYKGKNGRHGRRESRATGQQVGSAAGQQGSRAAAWGGPARVGFGAVWRGLAGVGCERAGWQLPAELHARAVQLRWGGLAGWASSCKLVAPVKPVEPVEPVKPPSSAFHSTASCLAALSLPRALRPWSQQHASEQALEQHARVSWGPWPAFLSGP